MKHYIIPGLQGFGLGLLMTGISIGTALFLSFIAEGCGGAGGDAQKTPPLPTSQNIQCAHDGDVWICNEEGSCIRDESVEQASEEESSPERHYARVIGATDEGLMLRFTSGNITIIAECGSDVSFSSVESSDDDTTNTAVNMNVGLNQASQ